MDPVINNVNASSVMNPFTSGTAAAAVTEEDRSQMNNQDFLKLLTTSLQYQDPMSPMETKDMVNQMAQLTTVEQILGLKTVVEKLSESMLGNQIQQGSSLLGKSVTVFDGTNAVQGVAQKVQMNDGILNILVNDKQYQLGQIKEVGL